MSEILKKIDKFGKTPTIIISGKDYHPTKLGGVVTLFQLFAIISLLSYHLHTMFSYDKTTMINYETAIDY